LERNENWHGYAEEEHADQYQTTGITYTVVTEDATVLEMFLKGEIDSYGLRADDMADYISSKYTYFNDSESTWFVAMNPDLEALTSVQSTTTPVTTGNTVIKTPLTITEFRQALSYSLDRTAFIVACNPTSGVAKALLSSMMISDPDGGVSYRSTEEAKDAILEFWGLADEVGEGKEYATKDEAIESITGYDPAGAKTLFTTAYNIAVENGYITEEMIASGKWELQIMIGASNWSSKFYSNGYDFLTKNWISAVEGTPWEGHLTFVKSGNLGSSDFANALRESRVDLLFGVGYSGSMFDPYSFMDVFTGSLQYDSSTDKTKVMVDIEVDGQTLRASLYDWISECLQGNAITAYVVVDGAVTDQTVSISAGLNDENSLRLKIMAKCEVAILNLCNLMPLMTDASASLRCMRITYKTEDYILGVGRGGLQYYTYTMTDESFADFVASQGGTLNYKATE
jgi:ABC-type transport system substrate-binding protein